MSNSVNQTAVWNQSSNKQWLELNQQIAMLFFQQKYLQAQQIAQQALQLAEQNVGTKHLDYALSLANYARVHSESFSFDGISPFNKSEWLYQQSLTIRRNVLNEMHEDVADGLENIFLLNRFCREAESESILNELLMIREHNFGKDSLEVANVLDRLAELNSFSKINVSEAIKILNRSLKIKQQLLDTEHPIILDCLCKLAICEHRNGNFLVAEKQLKQILAIVQNNSFFDEFNQLAVLRQLRRVYSIQQKYMELESNYQQLLAILEKKFGKNHYLVANILEDQADMYINQHRYQQAQPLLLRAISIKEQHCGENHQLLSYTLNDLVKVYEQTKQPKKAQAIKDKIRKLNNKEFKMFSVI